MPTFSFLFNRFAHNSVGRSYDHLHPEIFNLFEEDRINTVIQELIPHLDAKPQCLDFGCGTGNITSKLLSFGFPTLSADISPINVQAVSDSFSSSELSTSLLLSEGYSELNDFKFDLIYTYSVLHHIPDYRLAVQHLLSLLKPKGFLVIDHEKTSDYYLRIQEYLSLYRRLDSRTAIQRAFSASPRHYLQKIGSIFLPRFQIDGDMHVWPDDYVSYDEIIADSSSSADVFARYSYLGYSLHYDRQAFEDARKHRYNDYEVLILRGSY